MCSNRKLKLACDTSKYVLCTNTTLFNFVVMIFFVAQIVEYSHNSLYDVRPRTITLQTYETRSLMLNSHNDSILGWLTTFSHILTTFKWKFLVFSDVFVSTKKILQNDWLRRVKKCHHTVVLIVEVLQLTLPSVVFSNILK